ncbi:MAG TPA: histidine phosphatase family protein [Caldilineaceae bacterium]|nr:histidine phosphatase family protein [Caldilineaceae bacterium]
MTVFYLVRHGQVERRVGDPDPSLTVQGRREAEQVAAALQARPIARVYASPLRRAQETAAPIAGAHGLAVETDARLRERANFGDLPGQTLEVFVALWERCSRERDYAPPGGVSSREAGRRLETWMAEVYEALPDGEVVAVTHGGTIADFLLNVCPAAALARIHPGFAARPYAAEIMSNGAITVVACAAGRFTVQEIALTNHLAD